MQIRRVGECLRDFLSGFDADADVLVKALRNVANEIEAEGRVKRQAETTQRGELK
jgi:hypothetical protein